MNNQDIEQAIQAKGLTAPRVTPAHIKALMDRIVYTFDVRPNGSTTTLAHAFLDGDFYLATGVSSCVSVENFDAELGKDIAIAGAKAAAEDKLWELEGYALRERLAAGEQSDAEAVTDLQLTAIVRAFVEKHRISCPEIIYQTDYVIENAYGLIEELCDVVGYYQYPEGEA